MNPQYSQDGKRIAYSSNRTGVYEIWVADADGQNASQLTSLGAGVSAAPHWSPDGQKIAFDSNAAGAVPGDNFISLNAVVRVPLDCEALPRLSNSRRKSFTIPGQAARKSIIRVEHPCIACIAGKEDQLSKCNHAGMMTECASRNVFRFIRDADLLASKRGCLRASVTCSERFHSCLRCFRWR